MAEMNHADPAALGRRDGERIAKSIRLGLLQVSGDPGIALARSAGRRHLQHVEAGRLGIGDVELYCVAFINAAAGAL